jgi:hypothetical protein
MSVHSLHDVHDYVIGTHLCREMKGLKSVAERQLVLSSKPYSCSLPRSRLPAVNEALRVVGEVR